MIVADHSINPVRYPWAGCRSMQLSLHLAFATGLLPHKLVKLKPVQCLRYRNKIDRAGIDIGFSAGCREYKILGARKALSSCCRLISVAITVSKYLHSSWANWPLPVPQSMHGFSLSQNHDINKHGFGITGPVQRVPCLRWKIIFHPSI